MKYNRIRALREDKDLTQQNLADYLNVADSTYGSYESGYRGIPSEVWSKLTDYYKTSVDYLMGRTNNPAPYGRQRAE